MSQAGAMPYQQQHAEHPVMWLLRKAADFCLSPLKAVPLVGGMFKFLEDKPPQTYSARGDDWAGSPEQQNAINRLSPQPQATQTFEEETIAPTTTPPSQGWEETSNPDGSTTLTNRGFKNDLMTMGNGHTSEEADAMITMMQKIEQARRTGYA
jgi:hypothetical protein